MKKLKNIIKYSKKIIDSAFAKLKMLFQSDKSKSSSRIKYGAAELKKSYQEHFSRGFQIAVILHVVVLGAYLLVNVVNGKDKEQFTERNTERIINVVLNDLTPPPSINETEEALPPPKLPEKVSVPKKDLKALEPVPVKRQKAEEQTIKTQKELEEIQTPVSSIGDTNSYSYSGPIKVEEEKIEEKIKEEKIVEKKKVEKTVFQSFEVEKAPDAVNLAQVRSSMEYPDFAISANIQGRVTVKVLVNKNGSVEKIGSISGPDIFHDEVRSKVRNLQFTPGLQNGKPVKVWVNVPFNFKLK